MFLPIQILWSYGPDHSNIIQTLWPIKYYGPSKYCDLKFKRWKVAVIECRMIQLKTKMIIGWSKMTITTRWTRRGNLDHNDKDDEEDKVPVQVGVAVPLLLLVETHLTKEKSLGNFLLLRCPDQRECFMKLFISKVSPRCYGWVFQYGRWCSFAPLQRICAFVEQR